MKGEVVRNFGAVLLQFPLAKGMSCVEHDIDVERPHVRCLGMMEDSWILRGHRCQVIEQTKDSTKDTTKDHKKLVEIGEGKGQEAGC